jgi:hypothetical protein
MGEFFNLDICANNTGGPDDGGFPKIRDGAAIPSFTFSIPWSIALSGLIAYSLLSDWVIV